jgi:MGT family glycosyltransferase
MARIEFLSTPLPGHVNPTLPVAQELVRHGAAVVYRLPEDFRDAVEATGARLEPVRFPAARRGPAADPSLTLALTPMMMTRASLSVLPQILGGLRADPPDLIVYDALSIWGRVAAQIVDSPAAMTWASYAMNDAFSYFAAPELGTARAELQDALAAFASDMHVIASTYRTERLNLPGLFRSSAPLNIVFVGRAMQPKAGTFDGRFRFVGPSLRADEGEPLDDELERLCDAAPLYVSLGTLFNHWPAFYDDCARAFAGAPYPVVIAGSERARPSSNVLLRPHLPQRRLLARARAFVTHGGMSSVMEALHRGVPMVLVPQTPEQRVTAARVAEAGAGLVLEREEVGPDALRAAVAAAAGEPRFATAAARLWATASAGGGAPAAAAALRDHAAGRPGAALRRPAGAARR